MHVNLDKDNTLSHISSCTSCGILSFAKQENPFSSSCRADPMVCNKSLGFHLIYGDQNIDQSFERKEGGNKYKHTNRSIYAYLFLKKKKISFN
jgi:hypothetical protein